MFEEIFFIHMVCAGRGREEQTRGKEKKEKENGGEEKRLNEEKEN